MIWLLILLTILQERAHELQTFARFENLEVVIEANGEEIYRREAVRNFAPLFRFEQYLEGKEFRNNLDLSQSQREDLDDLIKRANQFRSEFAQQHRDIHSEVATKDYWKFGDTLDAEVHEIVLQRHWDRATELVQMAVLRERGLLAYVTKFASAGDFNLSNEERTKLLEVSKSLSQRIGDELKKRQDSLLSAVTKSLDSRQSELFKDQCKDTTMFSDYLFAEAEFLETQPKHKRDPELLIETFREQVSLKWSPAEQRWIREQGFMPVWNTVQQICELLLNDESLVIADFSDRQRAAVGALREEIHHRLISFSEDNPFPADLEARARVQELYKQFYAELDHYTRDQLLEQLLLPHQIEAVAKQAERKKFARMGPIVRLMRGHFDDLLKINEEQHEKIQHDIEVAVEDLNQELLSLERSFRKKLIGALDDENQRKLKAAIGDECKHARGSFFLLSKCIAIPKGFVTGNAPKLDGANVLPSK